MIGLILNKLTKFSSFIILGISFLILLGTNNYHHITNNILAIIPQSENKDILKEYEKFKTSKTILLSIKGFQEKQLLQIKKLETDFSKIKGVSLKDEFLSPDFLTYQQEYALYLKKLNTSKLEQLNVKQELSNLYESITTSFFPAPINKKDPFHLFEQKQLSQKVSFKNGHLTLGEFGYLSSFQIDKNITSLEEYTDIYNQLHVLIKDQKEAKLFSVIFYFVENSQAIKNDVNKIILLAFLVLVTLYIIILRNISLLLNTLTTLASSTFLSIAIITTLFNEVSIFVIVFGVSISSVAIDYMFHHYMHGYYEKDKGFNKEVFLGMVTTILAFACVSFISFTLIKQISIFAVISLVVSYLQFTFIYPKIKFNTKKSIHFQFKNISIHPHLILGLSVGIILIFINFIQFDLNLKNLDYDNQKLKQTEDFFKSRLSHQDNINVMIKASSIEKLITNISLIKQNIPIDHNKIAHLFSQNEFNTLNQKLTNPTFKAIKKELKTQGTAMGFRKKYFDQAYERKQEYPHFTQASLQQFGIEIFEYKQSYLTAISINKNDFIHIEKYAFVKPLSLRLLFEDSLKNVKDELLQLGKFSLILILFMLLIITKKRFLSAINFLLFPLSMIVIYGYFIPLNILHIFMIFIILAISIDYAIYTSKSLDLNTKKAILYSLLSTFAGFGVLIISEINSLRSIGNIATIAVVSLGLLLIFLKRFDHAD